MKLETLEIFSLIFVGFTLFSLVPFIIWEYKEKRKCITPLEKQQETITLIIDKDSLADLSLTDVREALADTCAVCGSKIYEYQEAHSCDEGLICHECYGNKVGSAIKSMYNHLEEQPKWEAPAGFNRGTINMLPRQKEKE